MIDARLALRRVLRSLRRRIRCDRNRRNRGFLVPVATRETRPHVRISDSAARPACATHRLTRYVRTLRRPA